MINQNVFYSGRKVLHNEAELQQALKPIIREAIQNTLDRMLDKLDEFIDDDIYDAYYPSFYDRTDYLKDNCREIFEINFWNDFGSIGGVLEVNNNAYFYTAPYEFVHGSGYWRTGDVYSRLDLPSYLEIMNDPSLIHTNPFHFPSGSQLGRGRFWDDFLKWSKDNFNEIFEEELYKLV